MNVEAVLFTCCYGPVLRREMHILGVGVGPHSLKRQLLSGDPVKDEELQWGLQPSNLHQSIRPQALKPGTFYKIMKLGTPSAVEAKCRFLWMYISTVQVRDTML